MSDHTCPPMPTDFVPSKPDSLPLAVCGDVKRGVFLVACDCGKYRQHDRPHGFKTPPNESEEP